MTGRRGESDGAAAGRRDHPRHPALAVQPGMHPGVADAAERDEVRGVVVCGIAVDMMDVENLPPAADDTGVPVAFKDGVPYILPSPQGVLLPRPYGSCKPLAVYLPCAPCGKRALAAEPVKTVLVGAVGAERAF